VGPLRSPLLLPLTGTFTQQDTVDAPLDPANANRYGFAGGDPINNIDPTGGFPWETALDVYEIAEGVATVGLGIVVATATAPSGVGLAAGATIAVVGGGTQIAIGVHTIRHPDD
jgi:hypothetical protein